MTKLELDAELADAEIPLADADGAPEWADPDPAEYNAFVERANLAQIEVTRINAERVAPGESQEANFETRVGYIVSDGALHWRFDCAANIVDSAGTTLGTVEAAVVVTTMYPGEPPSSETIALFGSNSAALIAHPYLRETIAAAAQRIGLPNVLLPMMVRR
ncbi:MAG: hypothetical protein ACRCYU_03590 [Nocardioides sp.]